MFCDDWQSPLDEGRNIFNLPPDAFIDTFSYLPQALFALAASNNFSKPQAIQADCWL